MSGFTAFASPGYKYYCVLQLIDVLMFSPLPPSFHPSDAHSMFSRRKPPTSRVTKKPLFRFESSRHAISISSYMREQRDLVLAEGSEGTEPVAVRHFEQDQPSISQHLVCKPHNRNITGVWMWVWVWRCGYGSVGWVCWCGRG